VKDTPNTVDANLQGMDFQWYAQERGFFAWTSKMLLSMPGEIAPPFCCRILFVSTTMGCEHLAFFVLN